MIQSNAASNVILDTFNCDISIVAICITIICGIIVFSSAKIISKISSIIVPFSTVIFILMQICLLYIFKDNILNAISLILQDAFNLKSTSTGIFTFIALKQITEGLSKGMFSNEAGMGSTPIFECSSSENNLTKQATISSVSVFIDTVCLCTLTGIIFVASNLYINETNPATLVTNVFNILPFGNVLLMFCLVSFAISAIPCWSYYGKEAIMYLFKSDLLVILYKLAYILCIYIGCISQIEIVWSLSSIANALMIIPNVIMILSLYKEIEVLEKSRILK